jgi:hypothetical protein
MAWAATAALCLAACGGGGLPEEKQGLGSGESLWPLSEGSTWTYRIDDPSRPDVDQKVVTVGKVEPVPESISGMRAVKVTSVQPHLTEVSWQHVADGLVYRVREEDFRNGARIRTTTWTPATIKALDGPREKGWSTTSSVNEVVLGPDGAEIENSGKDFVWRVLAVGEEVTVPAGTFKAFRVQRDRSDATGKERIYWLVPGVGKIKETGERLEELQSYDVK